MELQGSLDKTIRINKKITFKLRQVCSFSAFQHKHVEKAYFHQHLECAAPKCWSKYTTVTQDVILICCGGSHFKVQKLKLKLFFLSCLVDSVSSILFSNKKSCKRRLMLWVISFYLSDIKVKFVQEIRLGNHT